MTQGSNLEIVSRYSFQHGVNFVVCTNGNLETSRPPLPRKVCSQIFFFFFEWKELILPGAFCSTHLILMVGILLSIDKSKFSVKFLVIIY